MGADRCADELLKAGKLEGIHFFSNTEGYAIQEASSKDETIGLTTPFFPYFSAE